MTRPQTKRLKTRVYKYLEKEGEKTYAEITAWYNNTPHGGKYHSRGAQYGTTGYAVSNVLSKSILFEECGDTTRTMVTNKNEMSNNVWKTKGIKLYRVRPMADIVARAIKSRRPIGKFPLFVQKEIRRVLDEDN
jgi:PHP family Zn ribbon phosphoesterase